jgi:hypothetical protein
MVILDFEPCFEKMIAIFIARERTHYQHCSFVGGKQCVSSIKN